MPSSSESGKAWTGDQLRRISNRISVNKILDIGSGEGTYINKYKNVFPKAHWTGVEVWEPYIHQYNLEKKYNRLINTDVRKLDSSEFKDIDIVFAGDILEHMTKEECVELVEKILPNVKCLIISIPIIHMPQGAWLGNPYEEHIKDDWSDKEMHETFGIFIKKYKVDNDIGVYILSTNDEFIESYSKVKIAIYTICKNEEKFVDRWAKSNRQADYRLVCDTGSNDNTVDKLREHGVIVHPITVSPWRFDFARGTALNLLPADIDLCIWQDLDEELLEGWREQLEKVYESDITCINHRYRHNNGPWQWHSKIHARHNCIWRGAVHETLKWFVPEKEIYCPDIYLDEHQDVGKSRTNYRNLLEKKIAEGIKDWRTYYFLANEYGGDIPKSIETRIKSYEVCTDDGGMVKSYIARNIARGYADINDHKNALKWFSTSVNDSDERESWFYFAHYYYKKSEWDKCYISMLECMKITEQRNGFTYDPRAWGFEVYDVAALAAHNLGLKNKAYEYGVKALELNPVDQRLHNNLSFYEDGFDIPFPKVIEIETNSICNRTCHACMRNSHPDREHVDSWFGDNYMSMEKIKLILDQAMAIGYRGGLGLSHYNEPLSDPRIVDICKLAKSYPFEYVFFHSNGDLLTKELAEQLDGLVNWITVSVYAEGAAKEKRMKEIESYFTKTWIRFTPGKLGVTHFAPLPDLDSVINSVINLPCKEPQNRFIINHLGQMEFCCDDLGNNFGLGSVSETNTLHDLWFDKKFQRKVKQLMRNGGRKGLSYCETCPRPHEHLFTAKNIKVKKYEKS